MDKEISLFSTSNVFSEFDLGDETLDKLSLEQSSILECATIKPGSSYKGVDLYFLDMSTGSATGTFKDWVACVTAAFCKKNGINQFVTQSSGNTANALAMYCEAHGIKADIFYLRENQHKIKAHYFGDRQSVTLHEVVSSEVRLKALTREFSQRKNIPWLPTLGIQVLANSIRADIVHNVATKLGIRFDWTSQAVSSGYGIFGFYHGLRRLNVTADCGYRFIGIQQTAICPYVKYFDSSLASKHDLESEEIIERTLFRSMPTKELYNLMESILTEFGGEFSLVSTELYENLSSVASGILNDSNITLTQNKLGDYFEKSGLINLIGVLNLIDKGKVSKGQSVLVAITGGTGVPPSFEVKPDHVYT